MSPQSKRYLLWFLTLVSALIALASATVVVFASQNELSLEEAINTSRVKADIRGTVDDGHNFREPMLEVILTNETPLPLTIIIPQITLEGPAGYADVVTVQPKKVTLAWFSNTTELYAYSLDYHDRLLFPDSDSEYELQSASIKDELKQLLDNVVSLSAENEFESQLAVWFVSQNESESLTQIGDTFEQDFSNYQSRVEQILEKSDSPPPSADSDAWLWWGVLMLSSLTTLALVVILRRQPNVEHESSDGELPTDESSDGELPTDESSPSEPHKSSDRELLTDESSNGEPPIDESSDGKPSTQESGDRLIDHLLKEAKFLSKGGMAEVYTAYDKRCSPPRKFIIKFPLITEDKECNNSIDYRFEKEKELHRKLDSKYIPRFIDEGECLHPDPLEKRKTRYLIQEFVDGYDLEKILEYKNDVLDSRIIHEISKQMIHALNNYIHPKGMIHRDLSLRNIMVDVHTGMIKVIDFGNSTYIGSTDTDFHGHGKFGTKTFRAPDKLRQYPEGDFFSLVLLIYTMYGGKDIYAGLSRPSDSEIAEKLNKLLLEHQAEEWLKSLVRWFTEVVRGEKTDISPILSQVPRSQLAQLVENMKENDT